MQKRVISVFLAAALLFAFLATDLSSAARTNICTVFGQGGNWSKEEQGIRFSVFNMEELKTVATFDTFSQHGYGNAFGWYEGMDPIEFHRVCQDGGYNSNGVYIPGSGTVITPYADLFCNPTDPVFYATGCKLDYLYRFQQGESLWDIAQDMVNSVSHGNPQLARDSNPIYSVVNPNNIWGDDEGELFDPFISFSSNGKFVEQIAEYYFNCAYFSQRIMSEDSSLLETVLMYLGFYINEDVNSACDETLEFFDAQKYILVIEPVYWVGYPYFRTSIYSPDNDEKMYYFYGTATERALFAEYYKNQKVYNKLSKHVGEAADNQAQTYGFIEDGSAERKHQAGYGVYAFEFSLECIELPLACMNHKNSTLDIGDGELVLEPKSKDEIISEYVNRLPDYGKSEITTARTEFINDYVFRYLGYDIITANELVDLTIDIRSSNSVFRPDEEVILSFYVKQAADTAKKYCPDITDLESEDRYGIRLNITTTNTGDIKRSDFTAEGLSPDCTILCDGMPDTDEDGDGVIFNLAFGSFRLPDKTGEWTFRVEADIVEADLVENTEFYNRGYTFKSISSNTGKVYQSMGYIIFSAQVVDQSIVLGTAPDTTSEDVMPESFALPDAEDYINTHQQPESSRSWTYYKAQKELTPYGTYIVGFEEAAQELSIIAPVYVIEPKNNVPSSYLAADGMVHTRSGYGIGIGSAYMDTENECTSNCTHAQKAIALFPEFGYGSYAARFDRQYNSAENKTAFSLERNPYSMYYSDPLNSDNSRVHFIPVWYPDGDYDVIFYLYDIWTPAGTVGCVGKYTVKLSGTLYDDWYIARQ